LGPADGHTEEVASLGSGAPVFEELEDLTFSLEVIERFESTTSETFGAKDDGSFGVTVVATFGNESADGRGLDGIKLFLGKITIGQNESYRLEIYDIEEGAGFSTIERAGGDLACHCGALLAELFELGLALACWGAVVAEGFVGVKDGFGLDGYLFAGLDIIEEDLLGDLTWSHDRPAGRKEVEVQLMVRALREFKTATGYP
jgi:hypothetical protein